MFFFLGQFLVKLAASLFDNQKGYRKKISTFHLSVFWKCSVMFSACPFINFCFCPKGSPKLERLASPSSAQTGTLRRWGSEASTRSFQTSSAEHLLLESSLQTSLNRWVSYSPTVLNKLREKTFSRRTSQEIGIGTVHDVLA